MKRVKSIIGIMLAVAMIAVMVAISASAAPISLSVSLDKAQIEPGDTVTASVALNNYETTLAGFAVVIEYDKDALTLTNVAEKAYANASAAVEPGDVASADGKVKIAWFTADESGIVNVSDLATLTFTAKENITTTAVTASFPANSLVTPEEIAKLNEGGTPIYLQPGEDTYTAASPDAPTVEIVPEGTLDGEEPATGDTGSVAGATKTAGGSSEAEVKGTYAIGDRTDMYKVEVNWGSMAFTYTEADETWNPDNHTWELDDAEATGVWAPAEEDVSNKVSLKNHSSKAVTVTFGFVDSVDADTITATWSAEELPLAAVSGTGAEAVLAEGSVTMALSGKYTDKTATAEAPAVIGEATVSIA